MANQNSGRWLGGALAFGCLLAAGWWLTTKLKREPESSPSDGRAADRPVAQAPDGRQSIDARLLKAVEAVEAQRLQMDQTVWAGELEARRYEEVIIRLWDELRHSDDPFAPLLRFGFGRILMGEPVALKTLEWSIDLIRFGEPTVSYNPAAWREKLGGWKAEGYRIDYAQCRHSKFLPAANGNSPQSRFFFECHVQNPELDHRVVVRANLDVSWPASADPQVLPVPETISVREMTLTERREPVPFARIASREIAAHPDTSYIDPVIVHDLNGNGRSDIILGCANIVYRNHDDGRFESDSLLPVTLPEMMTCQIADYNGDGTVDLLAATDRGLILFPGDGQGRFESAQLTAWPASLPIRNGFVMTSGDVDADGDLDVWLAQYKVPYMAGQMPTPYFDANDGFPSFLLLNDGKGRFSDATEVSGLEAKRYRRTYSASFIDLDRDRDLDLVVVSDFAGVDVFLNDGTGRFLDVTASWVDEPRSFGMAHSLADFDLDGFLDLLVIGMNSFVADRFDSMNLGPEAFSEHQINRSRMAYGNRLYFGDGLSMKQRDPGHHLALSGWSWGVATFDMDNDSDLDVYIANGHKSRQSALDYETEFWRSDIYLGGSEQDETLDYYFRKKGSQLYGAGYSYGGHYANHLYLSAEGETFSEVGYLLGLAIREDCRNVLAEDFNNDGRLDLIVTTSEVWPRERQTIHLYQNNSDNEQHWIGFKLRAKNGHRNPMGVRVRLRAGDRTFLRWLVSGDSYRSQSSAAVHFGLGSVAAVDRVTFEWPGGENTVIENPATNQYHDVGEEDNDQ